MEDTVGPRYSTMIGDLPRGERPRDMGAGSLSNSELIATLLRTGVGGESVLNLSTRLLSRFEGLAGMARASPTTSVWSLTPDAGTDADRIPTAMGSQVRGSPATTFRMLSLNVVVANSMCSSSIT